MKKLLIFFVLSLLVQPSFADECEPLPKKVEKFIESYAKDVRWAEYCQFRKLTRGDINSDGIKDLVVIFNIEGACGSDKATTPGACGNHHETYLKVFLGIELIEVPILMIGRRGERFIGQPVVVNGGIQVETTSYRKEDPMCCPSVKGKTEFVLNKNVLIEKRP